MACSTQESQNLTQTALAELCHIPLNYVNFLEPLATDLDNIREQSFMDDGTSCSRLIAPDFAIGVSSATAVNTTNTNILVATLPAVAYPSRIIISGKILMAFGAAPTGNTVTATLSTGGYMGSGGTAVTTTIFNKFLASAYSEDKFISYVVNIPASASPNIYLTAIGTVAGIGSLTGAIQIIRIHQ